MSEQIETLYRMRGLRQLVYPGTKKAPRTES